MTLGPRIALFCAAAASTLALTPTVHAAQSALVGRIKSDGTIQLFTNRFQTHFVDGTPVAKIEATRVYGVVHVHRRSAACGPIGTVQPYVSPCECVVRKSDVVVVESGDYCRQRFQLFPVWNLSSWVLSQFIQ